MQQRNATAAVIGAGDFIGSAIAKRFAREGYTVFAGRRTADKLLPLKSAIERDGGVCVARGLDARKEEDIAAFLKAADETAPLEVCIFNPGANVNFPVLETTERVFRKVWELACYAGFLSGREAARLMLPRGKGTILFTGATASVRGGVGYAAFASAKFGLRAVAQCLARELGPQNIHVAHLLIDAGVDTAFVRERIKSRGGEEALARLAPDQLMDPEIGRECILVSSFPAARWLDIRTRHPALHGEMVMIGVQFLFDFGSPNAFLAHRVIPEIEKRTGTTFECVPVLLGGIFKATGNKSPAVAFAGIRNKPEYERLETERFVKRHGIPDFRFNPFFPVNTLLLMRTAVAAQLDGMLPRFIDAVFRHMWTKPKKMDDPEIVRAAFAEDGFDAGRLLARAQDSDVKARLIANTEDAVARGTFGIPTFFVGTDIYFGKDRLRDVEEAIDASRRAKS